MIKAILRGIYSRYFVTRGYLPFRQINGGTPDQTRAKWAAMRTMEKMVGGHARHQICGICKQGFWAVKRAHLCPSLACHIKYQLRK